MTRVYLCSQMQCVSPEMESRLLFASTQKYNGLIQSIFYCSAGDAVWATGFCGVAVITAAVVVCYHDTGMSHYGYGSHKVK